MAIVIGPDDKMSGTAVVTPPPEPEQAPEADETEESE